MPKNVSLTNKQALFSIPLPNHGGAYTVVSHKFIVDEVLVQLQANNLKVVDEVYKTNLNGEIAQGTYVLEYGNDPDLSLMFAWVNSYDKSMRFKCGVGASITMNNGFMFAGDISNYGRKHIHNAQQEVKDHIADQLSKAASYYKQLSDNKNAMKSIYLDAKETGSLLGRLFYTYDAITSSQLISIKDNTRKALNSGNMRLWTLYATICDTLRSSHPKTWMEQQKDLHNEVSNVYLIPFYEALTASQTKQEEQLPGQTNLLDQIEEMEKKTISSEEIVEKFSLDEPAVLSLDDYFTEIINEGQYDSDLEKATFSNPEEETEEKETFNIEDNTAFPTAPTDIPVYIPNNEGEIEEESKLTITSVEIPLHEQIAAEEVLPITEEEKAISAPPIVNKEDEFPMAQPSTLSTMPDFEF